MTNPMDPGTPPPPPETPPPPAAPPAPPPPPAAPAMAWAAPREEAGPAPGVKFASHGLRLIAYIVDTLIVGFVFTVIVVIMATALFAGAGLSGFWRGDLRDRDLTPAMIGALVAFSLLVLLVSLVALAYFPYFWAKSGQTPGMRMFGLYVVRDTDGGKISGGQAILRLIGMWISIIPLYLGFIWVFIDARRRGWHDLIAGTVVIERTH